MPLPTVLVGSATHGFTELDALLLVCGYAAKLAWSHEKAPLGKRRAAFKFAVPMLLAAAALEVFVTPLVVDKLM